MTREQRTKGLMQRGFSLLRSYRYREALKVGRKLKRLRHSSCFEIMALAYLRLGALPKAIAILEQGVAKAGRVWLLWELLGNCYSDAGRYGAAQTAYQEALSRENCDPEVIHLNRAIAFERAGKLKKCWAAIQQVEAPRLSRRADALRIGVLRSLGNKRAASRLALSLSRRPIPAADVDSLSESSILTTCALALKDNPKTRLKARNLAFRAVGLNLTNLSALSLIREIDQQRSPRSSLHQLLIQGVWNEPFGRSKTPPGFFRTCQVAARNERTAFRYAKRFFPAEVRSSLTIEEHKTIPWDEVTLDGVYSLTGFMFYPRRIKLHRGRAHP